MVLAPRLTSVIANGDPMHDIPTCLIDKYEQDAFFGDVRCHLGQYMQFKKAEGLIFLSNSGHWILCIPDILIDHQKIHEIIISHAHSILAHLGARKTMYYLKENVWWPSLTADVKAFCESCKLCAISKSNTTALYGLLHALPVPDVPWEIIGIDFVGPLPES